MGSTLLAFILLVSFSLWSFDLFSILLGNISIDVYLSLFASIAGFVLLSRSMERPYSLRTRLGRKVNYANLVRKRLRRQVDLTFEQTRTSLYGSTYEQHSRCRSDNTSAVRPVGVTGAWTKPALWIVAGVLMLLTVVTTADSFIKPVNWTTTSTATANTIDVSFSYSAFMTPTSSGCNSGLSTANTIDVSFSYSAFMTPPSSFSTATTTTTVFPSSNTFGSFAFSDYSS